MAGGDPYAAHQWLCALGEAQRTTILPLFPVDVTDEPQLVRIALAVADRDLAATAMEQAQRRAERNPHAPTIVATAAHARGLLDADDATLTHAVELFEMAPHRSPEHRPWRTWAPSGSATARQTKESRPWTPPW